MLSSSCMQLPKQNQRKNIQLFQQDYIPNLMKNGIPKIVWEFWKGIFST